MNLKITSKQMQTYADHQRMPTLQEFADVLCEDNEIQYVELESKKVATLDKIEVGDATSIFTKLKEYPYEFEINSSLQLASIDGIQIASNTVSSEQYNEILNRLAVLEAKITPTVLWTGSATNGTLTLSDSIYNYSYLIINFNGTDTIVSVKKSGMSTIYNGSTWANGGSSNSVVYGGYLFSNISEDGKTLTLTRAGYGNASSVWVANLYIYSIAGIL